MCQQHLWTLPLYGLFHSQRQCDTDDKSRPPTPRVPIDWHRGESECWSKSQLRQEKIVASPSLSAREVLETSETCPDRFLLIRRARTTAWHSNMARERAGLLADALWRVLGRFVFTPDCQCLRRILDMATANQSSIKQLNKTKATHVYTAALSASSH